MRTPINSPCDAVVADTIMNLPAPLDEAARYSRYLDQLCSARPELIEMLAASCTQPLAAQRFAPLLEHWTPAAAAQPLNSGLRRLRQFVFAHTAARDLGGLATLDEVVSTMTAFAEFCIEHAQRTLADDLCERHGQPCGASGALQALGCLGMGKLGGGELNVSSDIDLIFVYPEEGETAGPLPLENFEFFTRLGRRLIEALAKVTEDGFVFRVDMRLRPWGDSGPLVTTHDALENYFIAHGREWERYAWLKARALTGTRQAELEAIRLPFVFRKYFDFGAIDALRGLHAQIRREVARRELADDIKLGPGGIREIEFIAQVHQIIRGGRDPELRVRGTRAALARIRERGLIDAETVAGLLAAYDFLRRLEHRLQYLDDAQTHRLPERAEDRERIAQALGHPDFTALTVVLDQHRALVTQAFERIFANPTNGEPAGPRMSGAVDGSDPHALSQLGYAHPDEAAERLARLRASARYQQMPQAVRARFDPLVPAVVRSAAACPNPDDTLARLLDLLEAVSRRSAYLALLNEYPPTLAKIAALVSASSWAAQYLTRHPVLLDELLDSRLLDSEPDWGAYARELGQRLDEFEPDTERQMDLMRDSHHAQVFRLLLKDLAGRLSVERLADHLSLLADTLLAETLRRVWTKLPAARARAGTPPAFAVIGYGKLGGKELGYAADLDIIFLFDDPDPDAPELYARFAQRLNTWLSLRTPAGILFETDLRLRPSGESGLLVSSIDAFATYQRESAWIWEHQALTRARFCAGDARVGAAFERIREEILTRARDRTALAAEVVDMRARMFAEHGDKSEGFNLKHDLGGIIDVEFIVQYLVLGWSGEHRELTANLGNIALLGIAGRLGLIPIELAEPVQQAYREFRRLQHRQRLNGARSVVVPDAELADARAAVVALWRHLFGDRA